MTPREKTAELYTKCWDKISIDDDGDKHEVIKQFLLMAVDEITNSVVVTNLSVAENQFVYWEQVKEEINKL
jgi:hypothetical protein